MAETLSIGLLVAAVLGLRRWTRTLFAPATFVPSYWVVVLSASLMALPVGFYTTGYYVATAMVLIYSVAALWGEHIFSRAKEDIVEVKFEKIWFLKWCLAVSCVLGVLYLSLVLRYAGAATGMVGSVEDTSAELVRIRYEGFRIPASINFLITFMYLGAFLSGWLVGLDSRLRTKERFLVAVPLLTSVLLALLTTARTPFLLSAIFFVSAMVAANLFVSRLSDRSRYVLTPRVRRLSIQIVGIVSLAFVLVGMLRIRSGNSLELLLNKLSSYFVGVAGLSIWMERTSHGSYGMGASSFAGIFEALGLSSRIAGLTDEFYRTITGAFSNLYTAFRWIIEDFGIMGSFALMLALGLFGGAVWSRAREGSKVAAAVHAVSLSAWSWSYVAVIFSYNSLVAASLLFIVVIWWTYRDSHG